MSLSSTSHRIVRFGVFEADLQAGELRRSGLRQKLGPQPFQLLQAMLERPGELVTRDELRERLWDGNTFVDYEAALKKCVNRVREALGDSAESPRFIETVPRRGYRFIAPVEILGSRLLEPQPSVQPDLVGSAEASLRPSLPTPVNAKPAGTALPNRRAFTWIGIALTLLVIAGLSWLLWRPHPALPTLNPVPFTSYPGMQFAPAFSPDGSHIAFAWDGGNANGTTSAGLDLYAKAIGSETLLRLTHHPSEWISPAWSPDGTQVAFHRIAPPDTGIYVVPALGGPERKLRSTHISYELAGGISWSPDGKWLAYADTVGDRPNDRMFLLSMETGESQQVPGHPECNHEGDLTFQHKGNTVAFVCVHSSTNVDLETLPFGALGAAPRRVASLHDYVFGIAWSGDDRRLIVSQDSVEGAWIDEIQVSDGTVRKLPFEPSGNWPAVSPTGDLFAYSTVSNRLSIHRRDLSQPDGATAELTPSTREQDFAQYSPDGKHVAFDSQRAGAWSVWAADADGSNPVQISQGDPAGFPRWSPDSRRIAFEMRTGDRYGVYVADIVERIPRKLASNVPDMRAPGWSHDGKWIYFLSNRFKPARQIYRCPASGGAAQLLGSTANFMAPQESFDGKTLYFTSWNFQDELRMIALDSPRKDSAVAGMSAVADQGLWTVVRDGIYFVPRAAPETLARFDFATRRVRNLFKVQGGFGGGLSVSPDGRYILFAQVDERHFNIMLVDHFR